MVRQENHIDQKESNIPHNTICATAFQIKSHDNQNNSQEDESVFVKAFFHSKCIIANEFERVVEELNVDILSDHYNKSYENKGKNEIYE